MKKALRILGWIALLAAFSSLGLGSDNPIVGVLTFGFVFLGAFVGLFMYMKKRGHKHDFDVKGLKTIHKVAGSILLLLTLAVPSYIFRAANFSFLIHLMIIVLTAVLVALAILAISIINNSKSRLLGYLLLIVISTVPALSIMKYDSSYSALGMSYYSAIMCAVFAWWGLSLISAKE